MASILKNKFVKCSHPSCNNTVGQPAKDKSNRQVCAKHRTNKKHEIDEWKIKSGCANKTGKYGFPCPCSYYPDPATLDINHVDGDNSNRDPDNIEVLCKMCHTKVTLDNNHHLRNNNKNSKRGYKIEINPELFPNLFCENNDEYEPQVNLEIFPNLFTEV